DSTKRIQQFLERQGFYDGQAEIVIKPTARPEEVDLNVLLYKGNGYQLAPGQPVIRFDAQSDQRAIAARDIQTMFHHFWGRLSCLWLCGEVSSERLRDDMQNLTERYHEKGYPGARVTNTFNPEKSIDRARKQVSFEIHISTRKRVEVAFRGNHHLSDEALGKAVTFNASGSYDSY